MDEYTLAYLLEQLKARERELLSKHDTLVDNGQDRANPYGFGYVRGMLHMCNEAQRAIEAARE